jgi:hypothetical protein
MNIRLEFKPQDCWVGAFWRKETLWEYGSYGDGYAVNEYHIWLCLLPCLPIHIWWRKEGPS